MKKEKDPIEAELEHAYKNIADAVRHCLPNYHTWTANFVQDDKHRLPYTSMVITHTGARTKDVSHDQSGYDEAQGFLKASHTAGIPLRYRNHMGHCLCASGHISGITEQQDSLLSATEAFLLKKGLSHGIEKPEVYSLITRARIALKEQRAQTQDIPR